MSFLRRVQKLPFLGIGVSTEYGAGDTPDVLDVLRLRREHPSFAQFLEIGVESLKGLDRHAQAWLNEGLPTTYHFLDINLDEPEDFDPVWLEDVRSLVSQVQPAWMCGDAGLWHFGRRDRGHMLLLPPVLSRESAKAMAEGIQRLREETGLEILPENPPGQVFLGDLHLLEFYAELCELADTGMLLDCAHLAIYQKVQGHAPTTGLKDFPLENIVEMHVAGGSIQNHNGFVFFEDDHTPQVLPETWEIFHTAGVGAENLRAVVFECERNSQEKSLAGFRQIQKILAELGSPLIASCIEIAE